MRLSLFALIIASSTAALAQEKAPAKVPASTPTPNAVPLVQEVTESGPSERLVHLKAALAHLERVGFGEPEIASAARIIGGLIDAEKSDEAVVGAFQAVEVQIKVYEVNKAKLRDAGVDWTLFRGTSEQNAKLANQLEGLAAKGTVRVLGEPKITTLSGREAAYEVGDGVEGIKMQLLPTALKGNKIRIRVEFNFSQVAPRAAADPPGAKPRSRSNGVMTTVETKSGEALVLGGTLSDGPTRADSGLLFVMTPRLVPPAEKVPTAARKAEPKIRR